MTSTLKLLAGAALCSAVALAGCKRKVETPAAPAAGTAVPAAMVASEAASQPTGVAAAPATTSVKPFDPKTVPVSTVKVPPFPLVDLPKGADGYLSDEKNFDRVYVIAGDELRAVEGRLSIRGFPPQAINMSQLEVYRNYDNAIKALGGVRVSTAHPADPEFIKRNGGDEDAILKKLRVANIEKAIPSDVPTYTTYLLRTADKQYWISYVIYDGESNSEIIVVEEKLMEQSVKPVKAGDMSSALGKEGHVALHVNFDTDSDRIKPDSTPIVDEIAKLMHTEAALKLSVEGHTDNTGDAKHNRDLSLKRAQAVVQAVSAQQIDGKRLTAVGRGADKPLADNASEEGKAKNRRVELVKV